MIDSCLYWFPFSAVEKYLSSEVPVFFELRVRYLQACEHVQEALALAKSCLEHPATGRHLYFHQAYLTCLYKASLHEHLQKRVRARETRQGKTGAREAEGEEERERLVHAGKRQCGEEQCESEKPVSPLSLCFSSGG